MTFLFFVKTLECNQPTIQLLFPTAFIPILRQAQYHWHSFAQCGVTFASCCFTPFAMTSPALLTVAVAFTPFAMTAPGF